ncbi:UvrD-helicase domain-containing protein [Kocuria sp. HSID16901]|uniref:UvrD-helicase domain-containing protein n=1 Tax=Kocuria sp. HSID16901 TaxID=2419505 RepID=UPI000660543B|nr:UvrD-helicase domain-containing protein [Kocuria sp. HSID16901]RUQ20876.1 ATP-dependent helicase [Kocuria sp. HSID16901]
MAMPTKQLILDRRFSASYDSSIAGKVKSTIDKLMRDSTTLGLHVEPIKNAVDDRVRTARVDSNHRMVFFDLGDWYMLYGVYKHDVAYPIAETVYTRVNPRSGVAEIRRTENRADQVPEAADAGGFYTDSELKALVNAKAAEILAEQQNVPSAEPEIPLAPYSEQQLVDDLGIEPPLAQFVVTAEEADLVARLERIRDWQGSALLDLATGTSLEEVRANYTRSDAEVRGTDIGVPSDTDDVIRAVSDETAASQFHLIRDDEALREALESGDFDQWRLFLHPDQRNYVEAETTGPFRLTGGAGTGKTVVLVHRAVRLARANPQARVLVVSYTKNLVQMIERQIHELAPGVRKAATLGTPGICVLTMDQVASRVIRTASEDPRQNRVSSAMNAVLGWSVRQTPRYRTTGSFGNTPWDHAIEVAGADLPENLRTPHFFTSEYAEVILPQHITDERGYLRATRTGRGTRLGRSQRRAVWKVVDHYRKEGRAEQVIDWDEAPTVAAAILNGDGLPEGQRQLAAPADHLLIDEAQDFSPTRWQLARAAVPEGPNDLFIAEDANQRIYGNRIVLGHYGIHVRGRSRRLRLNYRTTEQNLQWALSVLEGGNYDLDEAEGGEATGALAAMDRYLSSRSGPQPNPLSSSSEKDELDEVAKLITTWAEEIHQQGMDRNTLGILVRTQSQRTRLIRAMSDRNVPVTPVDRDTVPKGAPVAMTLHRAKGTEFSRVILFDLSEASIPRHFEGTEYDDQSREDNYLRERSLLYVGATRARDMLAFSWNRKASPFLPA